MNNIKLYSKLVILPDDLKKEADDFLEFLKTKMDEKKAPKTRKPGLAKGLIKMKGDFDEPLEDFNEYKE
jgi:hypothetical protein